MLHVSPRPLSDRIEILLIEDGEGDVLLVRTVLAEWSVPTTLTVARDETSALQVLGTPDFQPDLIILDLNLARTSGYSLLERLQANPTPIVVFSSSFDIRERERSLTLGAVDFVQKPLLLPAFADAVREMITKFAMRQLG